MQVAGWRNTIGEMVRDHMRSPQLEHYFSVKMTKERAQLMITQLGLYIRHRRDCWSLVSANCPVMAIKQAILKHEFGEVIKDEYSEFGHLHLIIRQAAKLGMSAEEVLETKPIPSTTATLYAWAWLCHAKPWIEALAALTVTEWTNDDRLLGELGGGNCSRLYKIWKNDLNLTDTQMPNFTAHAKADVKHSDMFIDVLEKYVAPGREQDVLKTARESMDIHRAYFGGMAQAMSEAR